MTLNKSVAPVFLCFFLDEGGVAAFLFDAFLLTADESVPALILGMRWSDSLAWRFLFLLEERPKTLSLAARVFSGVTFLIPFFTFVVLDSSLEKSSVGREFFLTAFFRALMTVPGCSLVSFAAERFDGLGETAVERPARGFPLSTCFFLADSDFLVGMGPCNFSSNAVLGAIGRSGEQVLFTSDCSVSTEDGDTVLREGGDGPLAPSTVKSLSSPVVSPGCFTLRGLDRSGFFRGTLVFVLFVLALTDLVFFPSRCWLFVVAVSRLVEVLLRLRRSLGSRLSSTASFRSGVVFRSEISIIDPLWL